MTADNWSFVIAAYSLALVVLVSYWRFLVRRENELEGAATAREQLGQTSQPQAPISRRPSP